MNWRALIFVVVALSIYSPFANVSFCSEPVCCTQMSSCCGHCHCPAKQTCSVAKPVTVDQQALARNAELSPRIQVELFTLGFDHLSPLAADCQVPSHRPESPPPESRTPQARLCLWLI